MMPKITYDMAHPRLPMIIGATMPKTRAEKLAPGVISDMPMPRLCGANQRETIFGRIAMSRPAVPQPAIAQVTIAAPSPIGARKPNRMAPTAASEHAATIALRVPILSASMPHANERPA